MPTATAGNASKSRRIGRRVYHRPARRSPPFPVDPRGDRDKLPPVSTATSSEASASATTAAGDPGASNPAAQDPAASAPAGTLERRFDALPGRSSQLGLGLIAL